MGFPRKLDSYRDFYQFYLSAHQQPLIRVFHFVGILLVFAVVFYVLISGKERFFWYCRIFGYGLACFSHAAFERIHPTTFRYPLWSLVSDFLLFFDLLIHKEKFKN